MGDEPVKELSLLLPCTSIPIALLPTVTANLFLYFLHLQDVMMRKKAALHLDSRYTTMIENAFYYSNPPDVKMETHKERPPMHEYIRRLLYRDLSKVTTEKVRHVLVLREVNVDRLAIVAVIN